MAKQKLSAKKISKAREQAPKEIATALTGAPPARLPLQGGPGAGVARGVPKTPKERIVEELPLRAKVAQKIGCLPDELLKYREEADGVIVAIAPDGRKYKFFLEPGSSRKGLLDASVQPDILLEIV